MNKKTKSNKLFYEVKWENYAKSTWEPKENIPEFIVNYYERTGNNNIPAARIKNTKVVGMESDYEDIKINKKSVKSGGSKFHLLVWDDEAGEMFWEEEDGLTVEHSSENPFYHCNTKKDKDKRICRHSFGVLFGCSPCGVGKN